VLLKYNNKIKLASYTNSLSAEITCKYNLTYQCVKAGQTTQLRKGSTLFRANLHIHCPSHSISGVTVCQEHQLFSIQMVSDRFSDSFWSPGNHVNLLYAEEKWWVASRPNLPSLWNFCLSCCPVLRKLLSLYYTR
jgi:hypothetical protein